MDPEFRPPTTPGTSCKLPFFGRQRFGPWINAMKRPPIHTAAPLPSSGPTRRSTSLYERCEWPALGPSGLNSGLQLKQFGNSPRRTYADSWMGVKQQTLAGMLGKEVQRHVERSIPRVTGLVPRSARPTGRLPNANQEGFGSTPGGTNEVLVGQLARTAFTLSVVL